MHEDQYAVKFILQIVNLFNWVSWYLWVCFNHIHFDRLICFVIEFLYNDYGYFMKVIISKIILYFIWRNVYCSLDTAVANDIAATNIDNETNRNRTPICALHLFLTIFVAHFYKHKQTSDFFVFFGNRRLDAQHFNFSTWYRISFIKIFVIGILYSFSS